MTKIRAEYRRRVKSTVWHFMATCKFWNFEFYDRCIVSKQRPKSGTLCDHCQRLEKKAAKQ